MKRGLLAVLALGWLQAFASDCTLLRDNASGVVGMEGAASVAIKITIRKGATPHGPFSERVALLPCRLRDDEFCYGAKLHPQLSEDRLGFIYVTYNTNLMQYDPRSYAERPELYWPRLVRLELSEVAD